MSTPRLTPWDIFKMFVGTVVLGAWVFLLVTEHGRVDYPVHVAMLLVVGGCYGSPIAILREVWKGEKP